MALSEQDLRAMIREAIARHAGAPGVSREPQAEHPQPAAPSPAPAGIQIHASHSLFVVAGTPDGECIIEPNHRCDHCGYCKSLGH
ncbi:MAG: hypothetical protein U0Q55_11195 [Vicinamibacterales bacterium]